MRLKAQFVARDFSQVYRIDYLDTYASIAKLASIRILFAIAIAFDLELHQMNVVTAFLANKFDEEIYMKQSKKFTNREDMICKLESVGVPDSAYQTLTVPDSNAHSFALWDHYDGISSPCKKVKQSVIEFLDAHLK